jgi:uroporphyrinogen decarboxylase
LCKTPELAAKVTIQPVERLGVDAAILFSDILIPVEAMGVPLDFHDGKGPILGKEIRGQADVDSLSVPDPTDKVPFVMETIRILRKAFEGKVPLIGFSGAPFTLCSYIVEGGTSRNFIKLKTLMYQAPEVYRSLMTKITKTVIAYLNAQIEAGAQAVQIFDTWGGTLSDDAFRRFSLEYSRRVLAGLKREHEGRVVPSILFTKGGGQWLDAMADSGADALGVDWTTDLAVARARVGSKVALQGNMDPMALFGTPAAIEAEAKRILGRFGAGPGHVFNLGHGVSQHTNPDHVRALIEAVHGASLGAASR